MINKIIYIPIEIKRREFDSRCYQALKLIKEGFDVVICKKSGLQQYKRKMKIGLVYFKSSGPRYYNLMKELKELGHQIIMMDEEGLFFNDESLYSKRFSKKNFRYIDFILAWGKNDSAAIQKMSKTSKIFEIGSPRIDLLTQKTNQFYFNESKKIKKKYGKFILLNTQLIFINHYTHINQESFIKTVGDKKKDYKYNKKQLIIAKERVEQQKKIFTDYKFFLEKFSKQFPTYKLIVRPHPAENHEIWKKIIKQYKNVTYVNDENSACSWMLASQFSIASNCTTAIESFFLDKFNINYRPIKNPNVEFELPKICGLNIENIDNLNKFIKKNYHNSNLKIDYIRKKDMEILKNKFSNLNGECSINKLYSILTSNVNFNSENFSLKIKTINLNLFEKLKNVLRIFYLDIKLKIFRNKKSLFSIQKVPGFNESEIFEKISLFKSLLGINIKFSVKQEEPGMFVIKDIKKKNV